MAKTAADRDQLRVIRDGALDVVRGVWSVIAPFIVWWAGLWFWRQVDGCGRLAPMLAVLLILSSVAAVVVVGAVPWLPLFRGAGSRWPIYLGVATSAAVLALYAIVMSAAVAFPLVGGSSRVGELIASAALALVPSLTLAGANSIGLLTRLSGKDRLAVAAAWTGAVSSAALIAYTVTQSAC